MAPLEPFKGRKLKMIDWKANLYFLNASLKPGKILAAKELDDT